MPPPTSYDDVMLCKIITSQLSSFSLSLVLFTYFISCSSVCSVYSDRLRWDKREFQSNVHQWRSVLKEKKSEKNNHEQWWNHDVMIFIDFQEIVFEKCHRRFKNCPRNLYAQSSQYGSHGFAFTLCICTPYCHVRSIFVNQDICGSSENKWLEVRERGGGGVRWWEVLQLLVNAWLSFWFCFYFDNEIWNLLRANVLTSFTCILWITA